MYYPFLDFQITLHLFLANGGEIIPPNHEGGVLPIVTGNELDVPVNYPQSLVDVVGCFCHNLFLAPIKFINHIGNDLIDLVLVIVPSTPEDFKIGSIATAMATEHPLMWKISGEIITTMTPMLMTVAFVKAWKIWRPI